MSRGLLALVALGLGCALATAARAEPPRVQLRYELGQGAGDCPTRDGIRSAVVSRLGYDPFVVLAPGRVTVSITARGSRYTGLVQLSGRGSGLDGERRVAATVRGCDELIDALALSVSLALDPEAVERVKRPRRPRELAWRHRPRWGPASGRPQSPAISVASAASAPRGDDGPWWMSARVGVSAGGTPAAAPDLRFALRYAAGGFEAGLEARVEAPMPLTRSGGTISGQAMGGTLSGCLRWQWLRGCALTTLGALALHSSGVEHARTEVVAFGSAGARVGFSWPVGETVSLDAVADLEVPFVRTGVRLGELVVWRAEPVQGGLAVGVGWRL